MAVFSGIFSFLAATLAQILFLPVTAILIVMYVVMAILKPINNFFYNSDGKLTLMDGQDALWFDRDDKIPCHFSLYCIVSGRMDQDRFIRDCHRRMLDVRDSKGRLLMPKYRQYVVKRGLFFYWQNEDKFDASDHIKRYDDVQVRNFEDAKDLIHKSYDKKMPDKKSRWYVDIYPYGPKETVGTPKEKSFFIFRLQHCLSDGVHFQKTIANYLIDGEFDDSVSRQLTAKMTGGSALFKILGFVRAIFYFPYHVVTDVLLFKENTPFLLRGPSGGRVSGISNPIDLSLVKKVKNAAKTSINDVLTACLAQTLKKFFIRHSMPVPKAFRAAAAVSLISPDVKPGVMSNALSMALMNLPMECPTPAHALKQVHRDTDILKMSSMFLSNFLLFKYCFNYLPYWVGRHIITSLETSMILTNMPIFDKKVVFSGHYVDDIGYVVPYRCTAGSSVSFVTYAEEIRATVTVDKSIVRERKHVDQMMKDFEDSINELAFQVGVTTNGKSRDS